MDPAGLFRGGKERIDVQRQVDSNRTGSSLYISVYTYKTLTFFRYACTRI